MLAPREREVIELRFGLKDGTPRTLDEVGKRIDALSSRSINAYLAEHPPRDFTVVTLGSHTLEVPH